jgi:hypothetical protein
MKIPVPRIPFSAEDSEFIESGIEGILASGNLTSRLGVATQTWYQKRAVFVFERWRARHGIN